MRQLKFADLNISKHKVFLWILALIITLASAVYQRLTGPTYPIRGKIIIAGSSIPFKLLRSEETDKDAQIRILVEDQNITGYVKYKRYKSNDDWTKIQLDREGNSLTTSLPKQPPAGKLIYSIYLVENQIDILLTEEPVIIRFKGSVPPYFLLPHILLMFIGMLYSNRAGIESLDSRGSAKKYMNFTIIFFFLGGLILGPVVQKFAFDAYWTGVPFGYDLTDNKTLIAALGWVFAWIKNRNGKQGRGWILMASILMLAVYLIPHSVMGSELDYTKISD
jgi:hypothetical protein